MEHLCDRPRREQLVLMSQIKYITNQLQIPIVAAGALDAWNVVADNPELLSRFQFVASLPRWSDGPDYRNLLTAFARRLPLQRESDLTAPAMAAEILTYTDGTIGAVSKLLKAAAVTAITCGSERIRQGEIATAIRTRGN
jgi:hypothetical protein